MSTVLEFADKKIQNLNEKCIVLCLQIGRPGITKKISTNSIYIQADPTMIKVQKSILDSPQYKIIQNFEQDIRSWLVTRCLPSYFRRGFYLIPITIFDEVRNKLDEFKNKLDDYINDFLNAYIEQKEDAKERLKSLYDEKNYLPIEELKSRFTWDVRYMDFSASSSLKYVSEEIYKKEEEKVRKIWDETEQEIQFALRESFQEMITYMIDKLESKEDGKPKIFHKSRIEKFEEFLNNFKDRNLSDDTELSKLIDQAKNIINSSIDPKYLRIDRSFRDFVRGGLKPLKKEIDNMLINKPRRKISFEDE